MISVVQWQLYYRWSSKRARAASSSNDSMEKVACGVYSTAEAHEKAGSQRKRSPLGGAPGLSGREQQGTK